MGVPGLPPVTHPLASVLPASVCCSAVAVHDRCRCRGSYCLPPPPPPPPLPAGPPPSGRGADGRVGGGSSGGRVVACGGGMLLARGGWPQPIPAPMTAGAPASSRGLLVFPAQWPATPASPPVLRPSKFGRRSPRCGACGSVLLSPLLGAEVLTSRAPIPLEMRRSSRLPPLHLPPSKELVFGVASPCPW